MSKDTSIEFWVAVIFSAIAGAVLVIAVLYLAIWAVVTTIQAMARRPHAPGEEIGGESDKESP